jgi:ubiquinone/menaquinone biosynthesis C-methylase UbiE
MTSTEQASVWLDARHLNYHRRQFERAYRSTERLQEFVARVLGPNAQRPCAVIDVGCGAGANMFHLSRVLPLAQWTGVDIAGDLLEFGGPMIAEMSRGRVSPTLVKSDFFTLTTRFAPRSFDVAFSIQTVSWLPSYADFLEQFMAMVKPGGFAFVTSLFTEFNVDARIEITEYEDTGVQRAPVYYNVYCRDRFTERCFALSAADVIWEPFNIDIELPAPEHRRMGTYTREMRDGSLEQFSGPLLMPWHFAAIRMKH